MDHSSYYTSKYSNYALNYPLASYEHPCPDYLPQQNDPHQILQQPTSHGYDSSLGIGNASSVICNGASSATISSTSNAPVAATAATIANKAASKPNEVPKHYYNMDGAADQVNYNATNMNSYNNGYNSCSKMYENSGVASGATAIGGGGSNGASNNATGYAPNINYGSYQDLEYGGAQAHAKNANQYYAMQSNQTSSASRMSHSLNATAAATSVASDSIIHQHQSPRHLAAQYDAKLSGKTSVIKPLNAYTSTPINYSCKYVAPYPSNNAKSAMNVAATAIDDTGSMHSNNSSNSSGSVIRSPAYSGGVAAPNYKPTEVICPEPITRYATNHAFPVPPNNNVASGHYLPSNNYNYPNHPLQRHHQNSAAHHSNRPTVLPSAYQAQTNDASTGVATYYNNNPNSLVVRPTPSNYPKCQLAYSNSYNYAPVPTSRSNHHHPTANVAQKHPAQKSVSVPDTDTIGATATIDETYDRHYHRSYNAMYNTNYLDIYDDYQYQSYGATAAVPSGVTTNTAYYHHQQQKSMSSTTATAAAARNYQTYGNGMNMYSGPQQSQHVQSTTTTSITTSPAMQSTPVITSTSSSQMISSNYDANAHAHSQASSTVHPIVPNPVYGTNKDYYATATTTATAPGSYPSSYTMYHTPIVNSNYISSAAAAAAAKNVPHQHHYAYEKTQMSSNLHPDKFTLIDLEEQINSSKILKSSRTAQQYHHHQKQQLPQPAPMNRPVNVAKMMPNTNAPGIVAYRKAPMHRGKNQQYVYNYNAYNNCYQQQWQLGNCLPQRDNSAAAAVAAAAAAAADNLKKQSLRDFLSSWNEDEEEGDGDNEMGASRKSGKNVENAHKSAMHARKASGGQAEVAPRKLGLLEATLTDGHVNMVIDDTCGRRNSSNECTTGSLTQKVLPQPHHVSPTVIHHDNSKGTAVTKPKIHVGITVDNGGNNGAHNMNLPDIIIDIENPKVAGECENFERANVIQGMQPQSQPSQPPPSTTNQSEKLYILDSIDVPLADLNKYRHLSVVNKLPDNIVLPSENNEVAVSDSLKFIEEVETNHARFFKNDFEMNVEYDDESKCLLDVSDLVECKNMTTVRNVKRITRKYRKQREYLRKTKMSSAHRIRAKIAPPPPTPAPTISLLDEMPSTPRPVDLSANRPASPIANKSIDNELGSQESFSSLESLSLSNDEMYPLDTLKTMCIKTVNTSTFRDFFSDFINRRPRVGAAAITIGPAIPTPTIATPSAPATANPPTRHKIAKPTPIRRKSPRIEDEIIDLTAEDVSEVPKQSKSVRVRETPKPKAVASPQPELVSVTKPVAPPKALPQTESRVPSLKHLATVKVKRLQYNLAVNIRAISSEIYNESEQRQRLEPTADTFGFKVKTLQELAREVANTIYSFNVKPLQDICKLAIEKFDNLFVMSRLEDEAAMDIEYPVTSEPAQRNVIWTQRADDTDQTEEHSTPVFQVQSLRELAKECIERQLEDVEYTNQNATNESNNPIVVHDSDSSESNSPEPLKILCENAIVRINLLQPSPNIVEVPTLRNLCEATIIESRGELPVICFVTDTEDAETALWQAESENDADGDGEMGKEDIYLCLNGDLIEEELAQIVGESIVDSPQSPIEVVEARAAQAQANVTADAEKTPTIAAIEAKIIPSPVAAVVVPVPEIPLDDYESDDGSSTSRLCLVTDDIQSNIQYVETVPQTHSGENFMVKIEPFKKYLQNKYVQTPNYFKMLIIHRLLKKYIVYQRYSPSKRAKRAAAVAAVIARRKPKHEKKKRKPPKRRWSTTKAKRRPKLVKKETKSVPKAEEATVKPIKIRILKSSESVPIEAEICVNEAQKIRGHNNVSRKSSRTPPHNLPVAPAPIPAATKVTRASKRTPSPHSLTAAITSRKTASPPITYSAAKSTKCKNAISRRRFSIATSTISSTIPPILPPKLRKSSVFALEAWTTPSTMAMPTRSKSKSKSPAPSSVITSTTTRASRTKSQSPAPPAVIASIQSTSLRARRTKSKSPAPPAVVTSTSLTAAKTSKPATSASNTTPIPKFSPPCFTPPIATSPPPAIVKPLKSKESIPKIAAIMPTEVRTDSPPCYIRTVAETVTVTTTPLPKSKHPKAKVSTAETQEPPICYPPATTSATSVMPSSPVVQSIDNQIHQPWTAEASPIVPPSNFASATTSPTIAKPSKTKAPPPMASTAAMNTTNVKAFSSSCCIHPTPLSVSESNMVAVPTKSPKLEAATPSWAMPPPPKITKTTKPSPLTAASCSASLPKSPPATTNTTHFSSIVNFVTDQIEKKIAESKETNETKILNDKIIANDNNLVEDTIVSSSSMDDDRNGNNNNNQHTNINQNFNHNDYENNNKNFNAKPTTITCDILERIAKKRIVKRRMSTIDGYRHSYDNYNYDTDEDISDMLSSYINRGIEQRPLPPMSLSPISTATSQSFSPPLRTSFERAREKLSKSIAAKYECVTKTKATYDQSSKTTPTATTTAGTSTVGPPIEWRRTKTEKIKTPKTPMPMSRTKARAKSTSTKHTSQEKQIREVCREANRYQRNILHKFAKLNFGEILLNINDFYKKLPKKQRTSSTSSSSSSSSTSSKSSDSKSKTNFVLRNRTNSSSSESTSSTTSSSDSSSSSSTWSNAQLRESFQKCVQRPSAMVTRSRIRKPIVDMEEMSRQANLCRAYSENIRRNLNLPLEMPEFVMNNYLSHVNDMSRESSERRQEPFVKLYRSRFIDDLAMKYECSERTTKNSTLVSRKRKLHI